MVHIFTAGSPTIDIIIPLELHPKYIDLATRYCPEAGAKIRMNGLKEFTRLREELQSLDGVVVAPGGSAPNTLLAMRQLMGDKLSATLLTPLGSGPDSDYLRNHLYNHGIDLDTGPNNGSEILPSVSLVFLFPDGDRRILNSPGTIKEHAQHLHVRPEMVRNADAVMLFGSTRETFGERVFDNILKARWGNHDRGEAALPLFFSLPTNHDFVKMNREYFQFLLGSVNVLIGNMEELGAFIPDINRIFSSVLDHQKQARWVMEMQSRTGALGNMSPTAFVTEGKDGATTISEKHGKVALRAAPLEGHRVNTLGAGDVTTGVFLAGLLAGMPAPSAATLAMHGGARAVEIIPAVPNDLATELRRRDPENFALFQRKLQELGRGGSFSDR